MIAIVLQNEPNAAESAHRLIHDSLASASSRNSNYHHLLIVRVKQYKRRDGHLGPQNSKKEIYRSAAYTEESFLDTSKQRTSDTTQCTSTSQTTKSAERIFINKTITYTEDQLNDRNDTFNI